MTARASSMASSMKVHIEFWGVTRRLAGTHRRELVVQENATVQSLMAAFENQAELATELRRCAFAIGSELVPVTHPLRDGDELAVLPPVSGG